MFAWNLRSLANPPVDSAGRGSAGEHAGGGGGGTIGAVSAKRAWASGCHAHHAICGLPSIFHGACGAWLNIASPLAPSN